MSTTTEPESGRWVNPAARTPPPGEIVRTLSGDAFQIDSRPLYWRNGQWWLPNDSGPVATPVAWWEGTPTPGPVTEPLTRNSVVLMQDGSVARRNTHHPQANPRTWAAPWTHYPTQELHPSLANGATDPGQCVDWGWLERRGIQQVLYVAPGPTFFDPPTGRQAVEERERQERHERTRAKAQDILDRPLPGDED